MNTTIIIQHDNDLAATLNALGVYWSECQLESGELGIMVDFDQVLDQRLEDLIASLARLRWHYIPGRTLQLELELPAGV